MTTVAFSPSRSFRLSRQLLAELDNFCYQNAQHSLHYTEELQAQHLNLILRLLFRALKLPKAHLLGWRETPTSPNLESSFKRRSPLHSNMLPTITQDSPLAAAIAEIIQPKLVEMGWSDAGQESALIEYIVLMLVNGKSQEQLATELSNDFLGLDEGDTQALEFSRWLFGQVEILDQQINGVSSQPLGGQAPSFGQGPAQAQGSGNGDAEMGGTDSM